MPAFDENALTANDKDDTELSMVMVYDVTDAENDGVSVPALKLRPVNAVDPRLIENIYC